ncbi:hypothetical protein B0H63DRAFT_187138 [Podospora didyma]|uniref:Autophagy-related protein 28 n=1 Tax=Podospora didyma TaxID=330526 RepID=A0AAE0NQB4_9PEZI|nr:hypothetical protein B0H63DRAFT_187138 [Podospora didyma]
MSAKSSFLPRLSFSRGDASVLPFHNQPSSPIRKKPSEYDLSDLSPRPENALLGGMSQHGQRNSSPGNRALSPSSDFVDNSSNTGSASKGKSRVLFAGPPPPIASSHLLYRDNEEGGVHPPQNLEASSLSRNLNSVLFDRRSPTRTRDQSQEYEPDTVWRNLQRREKALQKELQYLLDAQAAGLAANLDPHGAPPSSRSDVSDAGSNTPTGTFYTDAAASTISGTRRSHISVEQPTRATAAGEIIPVRQPRKKPLGLHQARTALARNIILLADLKTEEDANLAAALSIRKRALAQLRKLSARKEGITEELRVLELDEEEPLARELRELREQFGGVSAEITKLEERLVGLRNRKRWLNERIQDVSNRREAGLSGYKGALKEVDGKVAAILTRPPVKPLDIEAITSAQEQRHDTQDEIGHNEVEQSPGGSEFLRMRPERRTMEMAKEWWEGEVAILERRKIDVDKERAALEEGVEVWKAAIKLVSDFESGLRKEMAGDTEGQGKGKDAATSPEQAMFAQLDKMSTVMNGLDELLQAAEEKHWNLLICAIGTELEAFREADSMLRNVLRDAGFKVDHDDVDDEHDDERTTPLVGRSMNMRGSGFRVNGVGKDDSNSLVDFHEDKAIESDNEVPTDLLFAQQDGHSSPVLCREDSSENEVPPEFLAQHHHDDVE